MKSEILLSQIVAFLNQNPGWTYSVVTERFHCSNSLVKKAKTMQMATQSNSVVPLSVPVKNLVHIVKPELSEDETAFLMNAMTKKAYNKEKKALMDSIVAKLF